MRLMPVPHREQGEARGGGEGEEGMEAHEEFREPLLLRVHNRSCDVQ